MPFSPLPFLSWEHAEQGVLHAVSQQKLSTQWPREHSASAAHTAPIAFPVPQDPLMHSSGAWQSSSVRHEVFHTVPPQKYG